MESKKVYIIILNYNGWKDTIECLNSLLSSSYENFKVVIIDNCSIDNSYKELENIVQDDKIILIKSDFNGGYSYGNNLGIKYCKSQKDCEYIMICNNDIVFEKNTLGNMIRCIEHNGNSAVSPLVLNYFDNTAVDSEGFGYINILTSQSTHENKEANLMYFKYLVGSIILVDINAPMMDSDYFLYYDDIDYSKKLILGGYNLIYCKDAVVYHKVSASTKLNHFIEYIKIDSMVRFYKKHYIYLLPFIVVLRLFYYLSKLRFSYIKRLFKNVF